MDTTDISKLRSFLIDFLINKADKAFAAGVIDSELRDSFKKVVYKIL